MTVDIVLQVTKTLLVIGLGLILLRLSHRIQQNFVDRAWLPPTFGLILGSLSRWLVILISALVILEINGLPIKTLWAGLLSVTLVVAVAFFASWSVLSNIFSSILLLTFSRIRVGDVVELRDTRRDEAGIRGRVIDINAFFVTLEELVPDDDFGLHPPQVQIPSHFFFYRVMRHWPGENTQALIEAFEAKSPKN